MIDNPAIVNTINGTGEINYNQTQNNTTVAGGAGPLAGQVKGPQLTFDKNYLCMKAEISDISQDRGTVIQNKTYSYCKQRWNHNGYL